MKSNATAAEPLTIELSRGECTALRHAAELMIDILEPKRQLALEVALTRLELVLDPVEHLLQAGSRQ
jgi:hypothetical protein